MDNRESIRGVVCSAGCVWYAAPFRRALPLGIFLGLSWVACLAQEQLPPGVPRVIGLDGRVTVANVTFTSPTYQREVLELMLAEANRVARDLKLPEKLPITPADLREAFVTPFGLFWNDKDIDRGFGNVETGHYSYYFGHRQKFSSLGLPNWDATCIELVKEHSTALEVNTNGAYQLAGQWLREVKVDVALLGRDCQSKVKVNEFWNHVKPGAKLTKRPFVAIYDVHWLSPRDLAKGGDTVYIQLYLPTKELLQMSCNDSTYVLRPPLLLTNLAALFPGTAPVYREDWSTNVIKLRSTDWRPPGKSTDPFRGR